MSTLVISWDKFGTRMAGSAIRALEMTRALAGHGLDVRLAVPPGSETATAGIETVLFRDPNDLAPLLDEAEAAVVPGRVELMTTVDCPLVVDLYDPRVPLKQRLLKERTKPFGLELLCIRSGELHDFQGHTVPEMSR